MTSKFKTNQRYFSLLTYPYCASLPLSRRDMQKSVQQSDAWYNNEYSKNIS